MRNLHRSYEINLEPCKRAIGNAETAESKDVACVSVTAESELAVPDGGKGNVFPVEGPVPVTGIGLLEMPEDMWFVVQRGIRKMACVAALLP